MTERRAGSLRIPGKAVGAGEVVSVSPNGVDWRYISFRALRLSAGERFEAECGSDELVIVVIQGTLDIESSAGVWRSVGKRGDPFSGPAESVYLPQASRYVLHALGACEVALCAAPARGEYPARLLAPGAESEHLRGSGQATRRIGNILMGPDDAGTLFITEVVTFPGNWSSYPP